jgi:hypothetical protein
MSRRERRERPPRPAGERPASPRPAAKPSLAVTLGIAAGVFVLVTLIAELAGAANLGVALGVGQVAFGIAMVALLLTR